MRKIIVTIATVLLISSVSCRQEDEIMSKGDAPEMKNMKISIIDDSSNFQSSNKNGAIQNEIPQTQNFEEDGEIQPPPRK